MPRKRWPSSAKSLMKINFTKQYLTDFRLLSRQDKESVLTALELSIENPVHPALANHSLEGNLKGKRAISADYDLRILFRADSEYGTVDLVAVGNHDKVYRR